MINPSPMAVFVLAVLAVLVLVSSISFIIGLLVARFTPYQD